MIYDEETDRFYLNDSHMKNCKKAAESLKKQKPFSREEAIAQLQRNRAKLRELNGEG